MDRSQAFSTFQECVAEVLDIEPRKVQPDVRWREDLDADSLDVVEIILALNDAFAIKIPDFEPGQLQTVGQAYKIVSELAGHPPARPGSEVDVVPDCWTETNKRH
jgi:acyl carrier protein